MPSGSEQQQRAGEKGSLSSPSVKRIDILRRDQANRKHAEKAGPVNEVLKRFVGHAADFTAQLRTVIVLAE
jgi:hypothetical protein